MSICTAGVLEKTAFERTYHMICYILPIVEKWNMKGVKTQQNVSGKCRNDTKYRENRRNL